MLIAKVLQFLPLTCLSICSFTIFLIVLKKGQNTTKQYITTLLFISSILIKAVKQKFHLEVFISHALKGHFSKLKTLFLSLQTFHFLMTTMTWTILFPWLGWTTLGAPWQPPHLTWHRPAPPTPRPSRRRRPASTKPTTTSSPLCSIRTTR